METVHLFSIDRVCIGSCMENGQKAIRNLFEGRKIFNVPRYQRAYAWEDRQLVDFFNDIDSQNIEKDYFLGTILFQERGLEEEFEIIDIVDGQQRITTLIIFMKVLLSRLKEYGEDVAILEETYIQYRNQHKFRTLQDDNDFFRAFILADEPSESGSINTKSQARLLRAKEIFEVCLSDYSIDALKELKTKVEKTKVLTYSVVNDAEATLIFETTNDRGKELTSLEKIKSFLMYKSYLVANEPNFYLNKIQNRFAKIYRDCEFLEQSFRYSEDAIMQYHFIAFEQWDTLRKRSNYNRHLWNIKNRINDLTINAEDYSKATQFIDRYSKELCETFAAVKSMLLSYNENLEDLFLLGRLHNFLPLLIKTYKLDRSSEKSSFSRIVRLLEIMSFRVYGIRRRRDGTARDRLFKLAQDFEGSFDRLASDLKELIALYCCDREFRKKLLSPSFYGDIPSIEMTYLLWKYENFLRQTEYHLPSIGYRQHGRLAVEHIIAQSQTTVLPWMDDQFWETYLHSLGNLTLDIQAGGRHRFSRDFQQKYETYYCKSPFKCQTELSKFVDHSTGQFDISSLERRKHKILIFAIQHWDYRRI